MLGIILTRLILTLLVLKFNLREDSIFFCEQQQQQAGFTELTTSSPEFLEDLLESLKSEALTYNDGDSDGNGVGGSAIDVLHRAITKAVNRRCQRQLDDVVHRVELDAMLIEKDRVRFLSEQLSIDLIGSLADANLFAAKVQGSNPLKLASGGAEPGIFTYSIILSHICCAYDHSASAPF